MSLGQKAHAIARDWIGTPYMHQASCQGSGTDCLGLIRGVWRTLYDAEPAQIPAYTPDWSEPTGDEVLWQAAHEHFNCADMDDPAEGDVLLFRMQEGAVAKHLGIAAKVGPYPTFIHAYSGHAVLESPLSRPWQRRVVARFRFPERI